MNLKISALHPLVTRKLKDNEGLFENHGPASKDKPFYVPGEKIEVNSKSIGSDAYYFQPKNSLQK
jgi:hypothetical protein